MASKKNAEEIPCLPLIPIGASKCIHSAGNMICLPSIRLHPNPPGMTVAQQMVNNLEALLAVGEIDAADVDEGFELTLGVIPQEC